MLAVLELGDYVAVFMIILLVTSTVYMRPTGLGQLRRLERKLDLVMRHLGIEVPDPTTAAGLSAEVRQLADEGRKIEAIKVHREQTGLGLKDAKDAVEAYLIGRSS